MIAIQEEQVNRSLEETCRRAAIHARKMARQYLREGDEVKAARRLKDAETYARWAAEERKKGRK